MPYPQEPLETVALILGLFLSSPTTFSLIFQGMVVLSFTNAQALIVVIVMKAITRANTLFICLWETKVNHS